MRIYKFKDLTDECKHSHFLQIVLKNLIWCASPDSMNDPDEFRFKLDYSQSSRTRELLSQVVARNRTTNFLSPEVSATHAVDNDRLRIIAPPIIEGTIEKCRSEIGIVSFSATKDDPCLWKEYGGEGNGVCVEIDIPDDQIGDAYHRVKYVEEKVFHVDSFLESDLFPRKVFETFRNMLLTKKRDRWEAEEEIRFIGKQQNVNLLFDCRVIAVTFGPKVSTMTLEKLTAHIADHCRTHNITINQIA
jgi:hypothetical protein